MQKNLFSWGLIVLGTILSAYMFFQVSSNISAQENEDPDITGSEICVKNMSAYAEERFKKFGADVDELMNANEAFGSLFVQDILIEFRKYKDDLEMKFRLLYPFDMTINLEGNLLTFEKCGKIKDDYIREAQNILNNYIQINVAQKQTLRLTKKLKTLNNRIRVMNDSFGTLKGQFKSFIDHIPNW